MCRNDYYSRPVNRDNDNNRGLTKTASDLLSSNNPARWVAGIAVGAIAVAGLAITAISKLDNGMR